MRKPLAIPSVVVVCILSLSGMASPGQVQKQSHTGDPSSSQGQQGFFEYVLGKVNPNGNDYGASMQTGRDRVVEHTIDDLYFWSNVLTLLLLTGAAAVVMLQWRAADKKEVIAAILIAELWNGRVSDRIEIDRRTEQFNRLVETHNADVERALMLKSQPSEPGKESNGSLAKNVRKVIEKSSTAGSNGASVQLRLDMDKPSDVRSGEPTDIQQSNLLLQRRVEALQNSEQNLKQRLNQTTGLLDQERRRNATLKGA
jgi:hypothetical protein